MKYLGSVKTIRKHFLSLISNGILLTGILLMIGGAGALDYTAETGAPAGPQMYQQMIVGLIMVVAGFTLKRMRDSYGTRKNFRAESESLYRSLRRMAG